MACHVSCQTVFVINPKKNALRFSIFKRNLFALMWAEIAAFGLLVFTIKTIKTSYAKAGLDVKTINRIIVRDLNQLFLQYWAFSTLMGMLCLFFPYTSVAVAFLTNFVQCFLLNQYIIYVMEHPQECM